MPVDVSLHSNSTGLCKLNLHGVISGLERRSNSLSLCLGSVFSKLVIGVFCSWVSGRALSPVQWGCSVWFCTSINKPGQSWLCWVCNLETLEHCCWKQSVSARLLAPWGPCWLLSPAARDVPSPDTGECRADSCCKLRQHIWHQLTPQQFAPNRD